MNRCLCGTRARRYTRVQAQVLRALDNLETTLGGAGYALADVVRLITHVVDIDDYVQARPGFRNGWTKAVCRYAATLLGVSRLARPELLVELEAMAAA